MLSYWRVDPVNFWLVVWNMDFIFPYIGNVILPTDLHIFQRGRYTTNQTFRYPQTKNWDRKVQPSHTLQVLQVALAELETFTRPSRTGWMDFTMANFGALPTKMWSDSRIFVLLKRENGTGNKRETVREKTEIDQVFLDKHWKSIMQSSKK